MNLCNFLQSFKNIFNNNYVHELEEYLYIKFNFILFTIVQSVYKDIVRHKLYKYDIIYMSNFALTQGQKF